MTPTPMKIAQLDPDRIAKLRALEDELGTYLVALQPEYLLADLSEEQVRRLQSLEHELGVVLLAYRRSDTTGMRTIT